MQVILTHENADFDAIASLLGAHKLYPNATPVLPRRVNRNVQAYLNLYSGELPFVTADTLPRGQRIHRVILVDTQVLTTVRGMGKNIDEVLIIDHHTPPETLPKGWRFQGEMLGATTTLLIEALSTRLIPISRIEATLMLAAIYEDTGTLTYACTSARDLRAASWLMEQGASLEIATEFLEHPFTPGQQMIYNALKDHAETLEMEGHAVLLSWAISPPGTEEEISTLAHKLRDLLDPSAIFILVQIGSNVQLVSRSTSDDINVAEVAQHFGGGGHDRAAAALIREQEVADVLDELRTILPQFIQPRVKVRDLMSHGVRSVRPHDPIALVARQMLRTGHEGFPVIESEGHGAKERVIGLVTRNAVDRAMQHRWDRQPVERIMQPGEVTVAPQDSAERLRVLMIQSGWGQIPVVENGHIKGVVTRTDMIRMPRSEQDSVRQEVIRQMEQAFPKPLLNLIGQVGASAAERGYSIYFVGGIVRDLLLGQPIVDVDLVVEGDAIELGHLLANTHGGEIHTHSRFSTVKWSLPEDIWGQRGAPQATGNGHMPPGTSSQLPESIDLVTARTEFYEHPTALPTVERSSIKQDLHRRDFTINTLAIHLDPQRWGELLDFYGGKADLEEGVIRVLHSLSFVDDPTRILRAARFEARLGFHLDPRSEALIADALPLLDRITGGRIRHELDLIFREVQPEATLERLQTLGALQQIHPELCSDAWLREHFTHVRQLPALDWWELSAPEGYSYLYWMLFLYRLPPEAIAHLVERLLMPRRLSASATLLPDLPDILSTLDEKQPASQITLLLETLPLQVLAVARLATDDTAIQACLERYAREWRHVHPELTGKDLKSMGLEPGVIYRQIFDALRVARLDGKINTREEEIAVVQNWRQP